MVRTVRDMLQIAQSILTPRISDNRLSGVSRDKLVARVTAAVQVYTQVDPVTNLADSALRAGLATTLRSGLAELVPIEQSESFQPWEFYNALDLWDVCATAIEEGSASEDVTL